MSKLYRSFLLCTVLLCSLAATSSLAADLPPNAAIQIPTSNIPENGWPTIVLLHGYGVDKEDLSHVAALCASRGVAAILVDAPTLLGEGRRSWPTTGDESYAAVEPSLDFIADDPRFETQRVFIGGFSQGGFQSLVMANQYPDSFAGVLAMSPAGGATLPTMWGGLRKPQPLYITVGSLESQAVLDLTDEAASQWSEAGLRVNVRKYLGGHQLPEDLATELTLALDWLLMRNDGC